MGHELLIFGAGALGRETAWLAERIGAAGGPRRSVGFVDDTPELQGKSVNGIPVVGDSRWLRALRRPAELVVAIGDPALRRMVVARFADCAGLAFPVLIDPQAVVAADSVLGAGTLVFPGAIVSTGVRIGRHNLIYFRTVVTHDDVLGDCCSLNPGAVLAGGVTVGAGTMIGAAAVVRERIRIGSGVTVGAGAAVVCDLADGGTFAGVPARPLERKKV